MGVDADLGDLDEPPRPCGQCLPGVLYFSTHGREPPLQEGLSPGLGNLNWCCSLRSPATAQATLERCYSWRQCQQSAKPSRFSATSCHCKGERGSARAGACRRRLDGLQGDVHREDVVLARGACHGEQKEQADRAAWHTLRLVPCSACICDQWRQPPLQKAIHHVASHALVRCLFTASGCCARGCACP